jgi:hypothetical protein
LSKGRSRVAVAAPAHAVAERLTMRTTGGPIGSIKEVKDGYEEQAPEGAE